MSLLAHRFAGHASRPVHSPSPWGWLDVMSPVRYGWRGFRLTVFPPGTSESERRLFWVDRHIGYLTALVLLPLMLIVEPDVPPLALLLFIPVGVVIVGIVRSRDAALRARVRTLSVAYVDVGGDTRVIGNGVLLETSVDTLRRLDRERKSGEMDAVQYELAWGEVYETVSRSLELASRR